MALRVLVAFVPALAGGFSAHVHIGRSLASAVLQPTPPPGLVLDKGTTACPCELDVAFSQIATYLLDDGPGAHVFVDPLPADTPLRLDVALQRTRSGCPCAAEILLRDCWAGMVRTAELPELSGDEARVIIRCSSPGTPNTRVRITANEPRRRADRQPILLGV